MAVCNCDGIVFGSDNTYDIGASGATRPRSGYFGTSIVIGTEPGGSEILRVGGPGYFKRAGATPLLKLERTGSSAGVVHLGVNATKGADTFLLLDSGGSTVMWAVRGSGATYNYNHLYFNSDNASDIGAAASNRPRNAYIASSLIVGGSVVVGSDPGGTEPLRVGGKVRTNDVWLMAGSPASPGAASRYLGGSGSSNLKFNVPTGGAHIFSVNDVEVLRFDSSNQLLPGADDVPNLGSQTKRFHHAYLGGRLKFSQSGVDSNVTEMYRGGLDIAILRHFGDQPHTLLKLWAPVDDPQNPDREATLALVRGDNDEEFLDLYNNGYASETQYGIRIQKRGEAPNPVGEWRDFVIDRAKVNPNPPPPLLAEPILILRAASDKSAEFHGQWVRLPQPETTSGDPDTTGWGAAEAGRTWYNNKSPVRKISYWDWNSGTSSGVIRRVTAS